MNLHEECLLKYLANPCNLINTTEVLKFNNLLMEKNITSKNFLNKKSNLKYSTNRR